eukprot:CAMPEP_0174249922 /NCGR_PEP_ID=MMETSP0439-20130205/249_1 /TAXON_ID=0 /ORGANISM="Stereomyxa ramosa, Strain Chinc5" /LENGTH=274 /DNA_ID=CAMNT_0015329867 /DNA_START=6 /DNA_END=830 /DNA_ORIENTATION=+
MEQYFTQKEVAQVYDNYVGKNIPFYWDAMRFVADSLKETGVQFPAAKFVDLGTGTGNLAKTILQNVPDLSSVVLVDHSATMLEIAQKKLEALGYEATTSEESFLGGKWRQKDEQEGAEPNLVTAFLTLDHIEEDDIFEQLFMDVFNFLPSGSIFALGEKCANKDDPDSPSWSSFMDMVEIREKHMLENSLKTPEETKAWKNHILTEDFIRPLSKVMSMLEKVGFEIAKVGGARLPHDLDYDYFYNTLKVSAFDADEVRDSDFAYGIGIVICKKL